MDPRPARHGESSPSAYCGTHNKDVQVSARAPSEVQTARRRRLNSRVPLDSKVLAELSLYGAVDLCELDVLGLELGSSLLVVRSETEASRSEKRISDLGEHEMGDADLSSSSTREPA